MATLQHFAIDCELGDSLNMMLCDRLICGINNPHIQRPLLSKVDLDFEKALKTALAIEMADRDAEELKEGSGDWVAPEREGKIHKTGHSET